MADEHATIETMSDQERAEICRRAAIERIGKSIKELGRLRELVRHDDEAADICLRARNVLMNAMAWRNAYKAAHLG